MNVVFIFPGQGVQSASMLNNLKSYDVNVSGLFGEMSEICGFNVEKLIQTGSAEELSQTKNTQIIMYTMDMAYLRILEAQGITPTVVAGHSLGQYAALTAAGVLTYRDACKLITERSRLMSEIKETGALCAITSNHMDYEFINEKCREIREAQNEHLSIALYNSNKQIVVGGNKGSIQLFEESMKQYPEYRAKTLAVGQAFHTKVMSSMVDDFKNVVCAVDIKPAQMGVILNCSGDYYIEDATGDTIRREMLNQCCQPVQWIKTMEKISALESPEVIEVGPGNVLGKLFKNYTKDIKVYRTEDKKDYSTFIKQYRRREEEYVEAF